MSKNKLEQLKSILETNLETTRKEYYTLVNNPDYKDIIPPPNDRDTEGYDEGDYEIEREFYVVVIKREYIRKILTFLESDMSSDLQTTSKEE